MALRLERAQVLAYRVWAQGLHGTGTLDVLTLGLQDTPAGSAALALRHRTGRVESLDQPWLVLALTMRGSPHLHRRSDLPMLRAALHPHDNEALRAYLGTAPSRPHSTGRSTNRPNWSRKHAPTRESRR
jgi:hypothetical protein